MSACRAEALWATAYMYANLALSAYILGSITLLVVKSDEQAGVFRDHSNAMKQYSKLHAIPEVRCATSIGIACCQGAG